MRRGISFNHGHFLHGNNNQHTGKKLLYTFFDTVDIKDSIINIIRDL